MAWSKDTPLRLCPTLRALIGDSSPLFQMKMEHDATLALIARELAFLQANMLKEQQRLEALVSDKSRTVEALVAENNHLRTLNKTLNKQHECDTPSSEDSSPKSSFSTKVEVKPRMQASNPTTASVGVSPVGSKQALRGPKPPVPSRENINRLLAPPIPVRSTSLRTGNLDVEQPSQPSVTNNLERVDSGRETSSDVEHCQSKSHSNSPQSGQDEGFCSSHEDNNSCVRQANGGRQSLSNHRHRDVQKPSDIKHRYKAKLASSPSNLAVLQEHQVATAEGGGGGGVTTVTYWTGSFL